MKAQRDSAPKLTDIVDNGVLAAAAGRALSSDLFRIDREAPFRGDAERGDRRGPIGIRLGVHGARRQRHA